MLETVTSLSLWSAMVIFGPILLAAAFIYGIVRASNKRKLGALNEIRDETSRQLYREGETALDRDENVPSPSPSSAPFQHRPDNGLRQRTRLRRSATAGSAQT